LLPRWHWRATEFVDRRGGIADEARQAHANGTRRGVLPPLNPEGIEMNFARTTVALLLLTTIAVHGANAQTTMTREQVKAELAEAIRTGNIPANGDSGLMLNELFPQRYPARDAQASRTREQVKAELAEAVRTGNMIAIGELGMKANEAFPNRYPPVAVAAGKTREQVKAETAEAIRTGDIIASGELGLKLNELYPQRYAKARGMDAVQARSASSAPDAVMR
jgi:lambda repressor-like predicted transcriptional regulator